MLHVLVGPPASGKSTYALEHAREGDIIIDYDRLAAALTAPGAPTHQHPPHLNAITRAARTAAIDTALKCSATIDVYLIHSNPGPARLDHYLAHGAEIHVIDPGREVVVQRCKKERPQADARRGGRVVLEVDSTTRTDITHSNIDTCQPYGAMSHANAHTKVVVPQQNPGAQNRCTATGSSFFPTQPRPDIQDPLAVFSRSFRKSLVLQRFSGSRMCLYGNGFRATWSSSQVVA